MSQSPIIKIHKGKINLGRKETTPVPLPVPLPVPVSVPVPVPEKKPQSNPRVEEFTLSRFDDSQEEYNNSEEEEEEFIKPIPKKIKTQKVQEQKLPPVKQELPQLIIPQILSGSFSDMISEKDRISWQ